MHPQPTCPTSHNSPARLLALAACLTCDAHALRDVSLNLCEASPRQSSSDLRTCPPHPPAVAAVLLGNAGSLGAVQRPSRAAKAHAMRWIRAGAPLRPGAVSACMQASRARKRSRSCVRASLRARGLVA